MRLSRRQMLLLAAGLLFLLLALMPMRFALGLAGKPVSAARAAGLVWNGAIGDLGIGKMKLGNVEAGLKPFPLLVGRREFWISRIVSPGIQPLDGVFVLGSGVERLNGSVDISQLFPTLPLSDAHFEGFTARFDNGRCDRASGQLRLDLDGGGLPGMNVSNGLLGAARCDGRKLVIPLMSQSTMERINLSFSADGSYSATVTINSESPETAAALTLAGFRPVSGGYRLVRRGKL